MKKMHFNCSVRLDFSRDLYRFNEENAEVWNWSAEKVCNFFSSAFSFQSGEDCTLEAIGKAFAAKQITGEQLFSDEINHLLSICFPDDREAIHKDKVGQVIKMLRECALTLKTSRALLDFDSLHDGRSVVTESLRLEEKALQTAQAQRSCKAISQEHQKQIESFNCVQKAKIEVDCSSQEQFDLIFLSEDWSAQPVKKWDNKKVQNFFSLTFIVKNAKYSFNIQNCSGERLLHYNHEFLIKKVNRKTNLAFEKIIYMLRNYANRQKPESHLPHQGSQKRTADQQVGKDPHRQKLDEEACLSSAQVDSLTLPSLIDGIIQSASSVSSAAEFSNQRNPKPSSLPSKTSVSNCSLSISTPCATLGLNSTDNMGIGNQPLETGLFDPLFNKKISCLSEGGFRNAIKPITKVLPIAEWTNENLIEFLHFPFLFKASYKSRKKLEYKFQEITLDRLRQNPDATGATIMAGGQLVNKIMNPSFGEDNSKELEYLLSVLYYLYASRNPS